MLRTRFLMVGLALVLALTFCPGQAISQSLDDLITAAKKEGVILIYSFIVKLCSPRK